MSLLQSNEKTINLILLDEDSIFTLGLKEVCKEEKYADLNIMATGRLGDIYSLVKKHQPDLWILALDFDRFSAQAQKLLKSIPSLTKKYPQIKLVIIFNPSGFAHNLTAIDNLQGCCYKYTSIDELVKTFRLCAKGETYFSDNDTSSSQGKLNKWFETQCQQGLQNINNQLIYLQNYTQNRDLSVIDLIYWQGRKRELKLTKWLINKAFPLARSTINTNLTDLLNSAQKESSSGKLVKDDPQETEIILTSQYNNTYEIIIKKLQINLPNLTAKIQETDLLKSAKKKRLFLIIFEQWYKLIEEFKQAKLIEFELKNKIDNLTILPNLLQKIMTIFMGEIDNESKIIKIDDVKPETTENIFLEYQWDKIPFAKQLIYHQVLEKEILIDNQKYSYGNENTQEIEILILENLIIRLANYSIAYILNNFSNNIDIKDKLFAPENKSSRKVAMFRNNLVWQYRQEKYWQNPRNIFEDKYEMLKFTYRGIEMSHISHSRHLELNQIQGIPWLVTILIELRDSLARGVKALGDGLGQIIVYLLTEVIGKGIGLIGKGILQGIGSRIKN